MNGNVPGRPVTRVTVAALALLVSTLGWAGESPRLGQDALLEKMSSGGADLVVLDVRTAKEFEQGHVPGALNVPHDELEARLPELAADRDKDVVVYCHSGRRADLALGMLEKAGFTRLYHLDGDYAGWEAAQRPVERAPPARVAPSPPAAPPPPH
jgi:rhodanese-related sulfurtransferase